MERETYFQGYQVMMDQLVWFGFEKKEQDYYYQTGLSDQDFRLEIVVSKEGKISYDVIDQETETSYDLFFLPQATGNFVGQLREQVRSVLNRFLESCCEKENHENPFVEKVLDYIEEKYQDHIEFLWDKYPTDGIVRHSHNKKWYFLLMQVEKKKLGLRDEGSIEVIDLKNIPLKVQNLVDEKRFFPGYHMNKKHWFTILLDGSVNLEEIYSFIDESYQLTNGN